MRLRLIILLLIISGITFLSLAGRTYAYDWEVGDEFEITKGNILLFSSLGDIETCLRSSVDDPLEGLNSPLAKSAQEIFHYQTEKLGKGTKVELIDSAVLRITINPLTCYHAKATKGDYKTTGWFVDVNGAGAWNDYSAEPSHEVLKSRKAGGIRTRESATNIPYNDLDYIKYYVVPDADITIEEALDNVINHWEEKGRVIEIVGWDRPLEHSTYVEYSFSFFVALDQEYVAYLLSPRPGDLRKRILETHGQRMPLITLEDIRESHPRFEFHTLMNEYEPEIRPCFKCEYHFQVSIPHGDIRYADFLKIPAGSCGRGLPPFPRFSEGIPAYSDYWLFSEEGFEFADHNAAKVIEAFKNHEGSYYYKRDTISTIRPESLANIKQRTYKGDTFEIEDRYFDDVGDLDLISNYKYDYSGRILSEEWFTRGSKDTDKVQWGYDEEGRLISYKDNDISITFSYGESGVLVSASFFDLKGKPFCPYFDGVQRYEWFYSVDGESIIETSYDTKGKIAGKDAFYLTSETEKRR